jgi:hypothetical protein
MRLRVITVAVVAGATMLPGGAASAAPGSMPKIPNDHGWSGYTTYITTNVKKQPTSTEYYADARWRVPTLDCNPIRHPIIGASSAVGMWVGLGGVGLPKDSASENLVQAGIVSYCRHYSQVDNAVYQILPPDKSAISLGASYPVKPGDSVEVTVERHSKYSYSMEINDYAKERWLWAKTFKVSFGNVPDSADYIVEDPGFPNLYQADFGTVTFDLANYNTFPLGSCPSCGPSFLNEGYAWQFVGVTPFNKPFTKVGPLSSPVSSDPGKFSVTWVRGS